MGKVQEEGAKNRRKHGAGGIATGALSVTGGATTNIQASTAKSATLRKSTLAGGAGGHADDQLPKRFYEEVVGKKQDKDQVKQMTWYDEYFNLEEKIEHMQEENEKMKREIARRTERYVKNESEYRQEIGELERELRVRKGFEENADDTNQKNIKRIDDAINQNIDNYEE
mmetsp:Transcript_21620/g.28946  ORF Transcript_21620/g.28946 Transcript_21620/m.28946 type:complete len:170 (+) Transcript_21620:93-602(+)|eukprot:CAMPEP_0170468448 /NCGR_PEP_ID=MMETSP0123-20130129/11627_1 /TAXON_ID=182087 /ORGANISM="Favella ehrenbergii, Strain Fehren 1" /LENGTH=169 /DNA_ID=CAMNT_0010735025 /DNA_START=72 /DNA_END=581 /DNA_ORIENTATION=+